MPHLELHNVSLDYPIYNLDARSLTQSISTIAGTGGLLRSDGKQRTSVLALDQISLRLDAGDRLAVLGHNGAGKSTLLKVMSGFYRPTTGHIVRQGRVSAMLSMASGMRQNLTGRENARLVLQLNGYTGEQLEAKLIEIESLSELGGFFELPLSRLSSGMMMRLAFTLSTNLEPEILLLDEWVGAGDMAFVEKARQRMSELLEKSTIVVYTTHSIAMAQSFCTSAICLDGGRLVHQGSVEEVAEFYTKRMMRAST